MTQHTTFYCSLRKAKQLNLQQFRFFYPSTIFWRAITLSFFRIAKYKFYRFKKIGFIDYNNIFKFKNKILQNFLLPATKADLTTQLIMGSDNYLWF